MTKWVILVYAPNFFTFGPFDTRAAAGAFVHTDLGKYRAEIIPLKEAIAKWPKERRT